MALDIAAHGRLLLQGVVSSAAEVMKYTLCCPTVLINFVSRKSKKTGSILAVMLISQESCVNHLTCMPQLPCMCSENIFSVTQMWRGCCSVRPMPLCESLSNTESCSLALNSLKEYKRKSGSSLRMLFKT